MIRARFYIKKSDCDNDYRPVKWPIKYPYWCSAESDNSFVLVAYAEDEDSIKELWPEAYDINVLEKDTEIRFTLRFPKPEWYELYERELEECDRFIWVTDACLRNGIIRKVKAKIEEYGGLLLADIPDRFTPYEIGMDAFESKEEALKHAEERRAHLIEFIKKKLNAMINYAAKVRKAYLINNFDKILNSLNTLHLTVETMTLFVNDQAYNYILKLKEIIKTSPMYKHNIKRLLNDMDKEIKRYNASIYYINKERSEVIADITQAMEDCLMPYIDDLAGAIRAAVWSRGVSEERTEAAVLSLIVSSLATTSGRLISGGYQIMKEMGGGWGGNPFTFMSIDKIRHLSTSLSDAITGGEIALEEKEANDITKAMDVFIEKMSDSDIVDKVISILEEAESKNKEERS